MYFLMTLLTQLWQPFNEERDTSDVLSYSTEIIFPGG